MIEDGEFAQPPGDELELLAIFARHGRQDGVLLEEEVLEAGVEQERDRDALFGRGAEERQRRTEGTVPLEEVEGNLAHPLDRVAKGLEIAPQVAGDERTQLAEVGPDELLGEDEDIVGQQTEELQATLLFAVENRRCLRRQLRHRLARVVRPLGEDPVLERVALRPADLRIVEADTPRDRGQLPRQIERMRKPEDGVVIAEQVRHQRVLSQAHELGHVEAVRDLRFLLRLRLPAGLPGDLLGQPAVESGVELAQHRRVGDRKPERRRLRLVGRENLVGLRQQRLGPRENLVYRPPQLTAEEERSGIRPRLQIRHEGRSHWWSGDYRRTDGRRKANVE